MEPSLETAGPQASSMAHMHCMCGVPTHVRSQKRTSGELLYNSLPYAPEQGFSPNLYTGWYPSDPPVSTLPTSDVVTGVHS